MTTIGPSAELSFTATHRDTITGVAEVDRLVGPAARALLMHATGARNAAYLELAWRHKLYDGK